jgi:chromosome partitioning protein
MIIAIAGRKGGIGKTTIAVNLGAALAARGLRVLLVDLDAQASASRSLGVPRAELAPSIADVLARNVPAGAALRATSVAALDLITASADVATLDVTLHSMSNKEHRLRLALAPLRDAYDFIFLDCAPAQSLLAVNSLVAADRVLAPVVPQFLALEGIQNLLGSTARIRESTGSRVQALGLLLSMVDYRLKLTREIVDSIREQYGALVLGIEIRSNVRLAEAPAYGKTIFQHDPKAPGAALFHLLAEEFLLRLGAPAERQRRLAPPAAIADAPVDAPAPGEEREPLPAASVDTRPN